MKPSEDTKNYIALLAPGEKEKNVVYIKRSTLKWKDGLPILKPGWSVAPAGKKG